MEARVGMMTLLAPYLNCLMRWMKNLPSSATAFILLRSSAVSTRAAAAITRGSGRPMSLYLNREAMPKLAPAPFSANRSSDAFAGWEASNLDG